MSKRRTRRMTTQLASAFIVAICLGCGLVGSDDDEPSDEVGVVEVEVPAGRGPGGSEVPAECRERCVDRPASVRAACESGCAYGIRDRGPATDDCPNGAGCLNRCRSECERAVGPAVDSAAVARCVRRGGTPQACSRQGTNPEFARCFRTCRDE